MLFHLRTIAPAVIVGLTLAVASVPNVAQEMPAGPSPTLLQKLSKDEIEETVQISLGLTEQPAGKVHVDYFYSSAEKVLPEIYKPQKYSLQGYTRMKPGKRLKVAGQGILLAQVYLTEAMNRPTAVGGFLTVWQSLMRDITRADPESFPFQQIDRQTNGQASREEIAAAEKRLGIQLPAIYRETMHRSGPWRVSLPNGFSFEMLPPSRLMSVTDWLQNYRESAEEDNPEEQTDLQQFKQDIVFAVVGDEPWVLRRSGAPCDDGHVAFIVGRPADKDFYASATNACGESVQLEAIRQQMLEAAARAFATPEFTIVGEKQRLYFERNKSSEKKALRLYLKAGV